MLSSAIPTRFPIPFAQNAGGSYIRNVPRASQIGVQNGAASLNDGFVPLNMTPKDAGGVPPFGQDMNGILKLITQWTQWVAAGGAIPWDATFSADIGGYPDGAVVSGATLGMFFLSTTNDNVTDPNAGGAGWVPFSPLNRYAGDTGSANAGVIAFPTGSQSLASLAGVPIHVLKMSATNTGNYTLALPSVAVTAVLHADGSQLAPGELPANGIFTVIYDGANFQLQSIGAAGGITPAQLQVQGGNYAVDDGSGGADAMVASLSPAPASLASITGTAFRIQKASLANVGGVTLALNGNGPLQVVHADSSGMLPGELPADGLIELAFNGGSSFILLSPPDGPVVLPEASAAQMEAAGTSEYASPANLIFSPWAIKGFIFFRWNGSSIVIHQQSSTVASIVRNSTGRYTITMQGGLSFAFGYAMVNGGHPNPTANPGSAGFIGTGASFSGLNPSFVIQFGDSGGSGGQASDPTDAGVLIFGATNN